MKRILVINGSPKIKGSTIQLTERVTEALKTAHFEFEVVHLSQHNLEMCQGCAVCVTQGQRCVKNDDFENLVDKMRSADGILLAAPVYMWHTTSQMKLFLDRFVSYFHRPDPALVGKPVLSVATAAGPLMKKSTAYLTAIAHHLGMIPCGSIGQMASAPKAVSPRQVRRFLQMVNLDRGQHRPTLKQRFNFLIQQLSATLLPKDQDYFKALGWDRANYYYDCRIDIFNRAIIKFSRFMMELAGSVMFKDAG